MKRKILILAILPVIGCMVALNGCKKDETKPPVEVFAAMPATPSPAVDEIIPFTGSGQTVNLTWEGTATTAPSWNVFFGKGTPALAASNVSGNAYTATVTTGGTYHWQVVTMDPNGIETASPVWSFILNSNPNSPADPNPGADSVGVGLIPQMSWSGSDPENQDLTYDIYLSKTNPPTAITSLGLADPAYTVPKALTASTDYYWKIVAHDPYGGVKEGPVWHFKTSADGISAFIGDYNADEPAEDYSYGVSFTESSLTTITTDNYWNSGWTAVFNVDLTARTYNMPLTTWGNYSAIESGYINKSTGQIIGTYVIYYKGAVAEQGTHTYTKL